MSAPSLRPIKVATANIARAVKDRDRIAEYQARQALTAAKIEHAIVSALTDGAALTARQRDRLTGLLHAPLPLVWQSPVPDPRSTCRHGHPWTPENVYQPPHGSHGYCRACQRVSRRAYRGRQREQVAS
jgi:hypothetical protein